MDPTPRAARSGDSEKPIPWWRAPWFAPVTVTVAAFVFYLFVMSYPWQLAVLASTAIGALVYSTRVTLERMRRLYTLPDESGATAGEDASAR